jgi:uncharacterized protein YkwD
VTRPSPRAWKRAGVIVTLVALGAALAACGQSKTAGFKTRSNDTAAAADSASASPSAPAESGYPPDAPPTATAPAAPPAAPPAVPGPPKKPTVPKSKPKPPAPQAGASAIAQAVLDQTNAWRTAAGLRPYKMSPGLVASAHKHNLAMAAGCGLSHRCPGEADLGDRIHAQGVNWHGAGENCGVGGAANNTAAITAAAKGLNQAMFDEKPPGDGHRRNLLSSGFTLIGIDVIRDSNGKVWLTEDFVSN